LQKGVEVLPVKVVHACQVQQQVNDLLALIYIVAGKTQAHSGKNCKPFCSLQSAQAESEVNTKADIEIETILMHLGNRNTLIFQILEYLKAQTLLLRIFNYVHAKKYRRYKRYSGNTVSTPLKQWHVGRN
jgi:hypothetical protein